MFLSKKPKTESNAPSRGDDIVVAVMGPTGAGKSTWISMMTNSNARTSSSLSSCTKTVNGFRLRDGGANYVLVDTPGLNDTVLSDTEIVNTIIDWLEKTYRENSRLNAILYLHPITDLRMQGSALRNLRIFRKLCGESSLKNVVLVSSFWDKVSKVEGEKREQQLINGKDFWQGMVSKGCRVERLENRRASGFDLLRSLKARGKITTDVQAQIVDQGIARSETTALKALTEDFQRLQLENENERKRAKEEVAKKLALEEANRIRQLEQQRERQADMLDRERIKADLQEAYRQRILEDENRRLEREKGNLAFQEQNLLRQQQQLRERALKREKEAEELRASNAESLRQLRHRQAEDSRRRERELVARRAANKQEVLRAQRELESQQEKNRQEISRARQRSGASSRGGDQNQLLWYGCEHDARGQACYCQQKGGLGFDSSE